MSEQVPHPEPIDLAEARIDTDYLNAMDSAEWHAKLSNPGLIRLVGRKVLNSVGIETSAQQAIDHHERIMGNYAESAGIGLSDVAGITPDQHAELRAAAVEKGLEEDRIDNRIINASLTANIRPIETPRSLSLKSIGEQSKEKRSQPNGGMPKGIRYLGKGSKGNRDLPNRGMPIGVRYTGIKKQS